MSDERHDGIADVINLLAAPIASGLRTVEQMRRGFDELMRTVENVNRTMESLNEAAGRINRFLGTVEEPIAALLPQLTRTVHTADELAALLEAPVRAAAPNLERVASALASPAFLGVPQQLGDLLSRLGPLASLAENAGGLFGGLRLPGIGRPPTPASSASPAPPAHQPTTSDVQPVRGAAPRQPAAKKSAAKRPAAKRPAAKKSAAKKASQ